jgi:hypothetical protein
MRELTWGEIGKRMKEWMLKPIFQGLVELSRAAFIQLRMRKEWRKCTNKLKSMTTVNARNSLGFNALCQSTPTLTGQQVI